MPKEDKKVKKEDKKKEEDEEESEDHNISIFDEVKDAWKSADYSEFMYSGTATGTTTSSATMTSIFGGTDFYQDWQQKMKEKKQCPICKMYFSSYLSNCPTCGTKVK